MSRRSYKHIYLYIAKEFIFSFFVAFLFFFFIFFVNQLLLLAEEILSKKVPFTDVFLLILYSLPLIASLSFPFGSLVGALMTVGRFSSDNEILAFRASGIPYRKIFLPFIIISLVFSIVSFELNDYFLPKGTINFNKLFRKLLYQNPEMELEPYSIKYYQDSIIITGNVTDERIEDILIFDETAEKEDRIIMATNAGLREVEEQLGVVSMELDTVFSHIVDPKKREEFEYTRSEKMHYNILLKDISLSIRNPGPSEMSSVDVYKIIQKKEEELQEKKRKQQERIEEVRFLLAQEYRAALDTMKASFQSRREHIEDLNEVLEQFEKENEKKIIDRSLQLYRLEFHKKFAVPFACFIFILFAFPVGLYTKRSGRSVGFGIGVLVAVFYWGMLFAGQTLGLRLQYSPILSMWMPNIVIILLGTFFFLLRGK
jgi:lipopolysaccharide export system permease protein